MAKPRAGYDALNRGDLSEVMALIDSEITWDPGPLTPHAGDTTTNGPAGFRARGDPRLQWSSGALARGAFRLLGTFGRWGALA